MLRKWLSIIIVLSMVAFCLTACKKSTDEDESNEPVVKTMAEYEAEAEKEITEDNVDAELEKIEKAIDKETTE